VTRSTPARRTAHEHSAVDHTPDVAGGRADYGLASALSIVVFLVVGAIAALAFRRTRKLEEIL
jgi:arabinogalactan oligomer/maltooligosaccharide transport system permease protein